MVVPNPRASNETLQNAIFDYLNLNRHKFDALGNFDPTPDKRDYVPSQLVKYKPGSVEGQALRDVEPDEPEDNSAISRTLSKAGACAVEALPEFAAAAALLGLGTPTIPKRFVTPRSAPRTSIASKYIAPLIPGQFPKRVWTLRPGNLKPFTKSVGKAVARWIPGVGWALLAYDAYKFGDCMIREGGDPDVSA